GVSTGLHSGCRRRSGTDEGALRSQRGRARSSPSGGSDALRTIALTRAAASPFTIRRSEPSRPTVGVRVRADIVPRVFVRLIASTVVAIGLAACGVAPTVSPTYYNAPQLAQLIRTLERERVT